MGVALYRWAYFLGTCDMWVIVIIRLVGLHVIMWFAIGAKVHRWFIESVPLSCPGSDILGVGL